MQNKSFNKLEIMFKIREKVIALNSSPNELCQPRKKGEIYTITDIYICKCGTHSVNLDNQVGQHNGVDCECGREIVSNRFFTNSKHFRKLDYEFADNLLAEISEAIKSETILN